MSRPRGRPPIPLPPVYWRLRVDFEPPETCVRHTELAKLLHWQISLVQPGSDSKPSEAVSIPSHVETDDGEKHRYLRSFGSAHQALHGFVILRRAPPAGAIAIVRVRGLNAPPVGEIPINKAEKIDRQLYEQAPEELATVAVNRPEVLALIAEHLEQNKRKKPKARG